MKKITKEELCEALAEDYADKAASKGRNYNDSYTHYLKRCLARETTELMNQYKTQGLNNSGFIF